MDAWDGWRGCDDVDQPRHDVTPDDAGFWTHLANTPAALEASCIGGGTPWTVVALAGLQHHDWREDDGMDGRHDPQPGDRLQLVREPGNPYDANAIRAEWRNGTMLGHLPRAVAHDVAADLDAGTPLRAYVYDMSDGGRRAWAMQALLVGPPVAARHGRWTTGAIAHAARVAWEPKPPTPRQEAAADAWEARHCMVRLQREADLAYTLAALDEGRPALPPDVQVPPDPALAGRVFKWWDEVPESLMTVTTMKQCGLRPDGAPFATIRYYGSGKWRRYDLFPVSSARQVAPRSLAQRAAAAESAVWRRRGL